MPLTWNQLLDIELRNPGNKDVIALLATIRDDTPLTDLTDKIERNSAELSNVYILLQIKKQEITELTRRIEKAGSLLKDLREILHGP